MVHLLLEGFVTHNGLVDQVHLDELVVVLLHLAVLVQMRSEVPLVVRSIVGLGRLEVAVGELGLVHGERLPSLSV